MERPRRRVFTPRAPLGEPRRVRAPAVPPPLTTSEVPAAPTRRVVRGPATPRVAATFILGGYHNDFRFLFHNML